MLGFEKGGGEWVWRGKGKGREEGEGKREKGRGKKDEKGVRKGMRRGEDVADGAGRVIGHGFGWDV